MIVAISRNLYMDTAVPNILEVLRHFDKTRAKGENANVKAICNFFSHSSAAREESDTTPNLKVLR